MSISGTFSPISSSILVGGGAALLAAFLWAISTILFNKLGEDIPPTELNLVKCTVAVVLMVLTSLLMRETLPNCGWLPYLFLAISGIVGISIGDTAYLHSLNQLGSRLALLLGVLSPPIAGILSWLFLGEQIASLAWVGILITLVGVSWVIWSDQKESKRVTPNYWKGIGFGLIASLCQSIGAVISRYALTETGFSALQTAIIRLTAGILTLLLLVAVSREKPFRWIHQAGQSGRSLQKLWGMIALVGVLGTFLAVWLQQLSLQYAPVGMAQTLLSTSPIFILPLTAMQGEKISWKSVAGVLIALAGIVILFSVH